jgi:peroxiredoxin (alkyl hydroperoxide reductase subunit C)
MIQTAESVKENVRGVYIIDPDNTIRSVQFYPNEVGRNLEEIKRTIQALQTTYMTENRVTPANWQPGDDLIVPVLSQEERNSVGQPGSEYYQVDWFLNFVRQ